MTFQSNVPTPNSPPQNGTQHVPNSAVVDIDVRSDEPQDMSAVTHHGITTDYQIKIDNPNVQYTEKEIISHYLYEKVSVGNCC